MGFWRELVEDLEETFDDIGETTKEVVKTGVKWGATTLASGALVAATGGIGAIVIGTGMAVEGCLIKKLAREYDNEFFESVGGVVSDTGISTATGGLLGTESSSLASKFGNKALRTGISASTTTCSKVFVSTWLYTKAIQYGFDACSKSKNAWETFCSFLHGKHKDEGISYESDCPICNGTFDKMFLL